MMFLIRAVFWLTVVALLLPSGRSASTGAADISALDAVSAAGAAVSDVSHFCSRRPDACAVGTQAAAAVGQKAQAGAKMLYDLINDQAATPATAASAEKAAAHKAHPAAKASRNTLTP